MPSERLWHAARFGLGLGVLALACFSYAALTAGRARTASAAAAIDAREALALCAAAFAGSPDDLAALGSCGQALPGIRADALRLNESAALGLKWRSSKIVFLSLAARALSSDLMHSGEALAAFTERASRVLPWWQTAQPRLSALAAYDAAADMRNRSAVLEPKDFIYRLYRAKAALLLVSESTTAHEAASMGMGLPGIGEAIGIIDRLIRAVDTQNAGAAEILRATYLRMMASLSAGARASLKGEALRNQFSSLSVQAEAVRKELSL